MEVNHIIVRRGGLGFLGENITVSLPFKQLSVDLITDLPLSSGFNSVMVMVNHGLMKGVILTPCSTTIDAAGITQLFFDFVFK